MADEPLDIDEERQREITELLAQVGKVSLYDLLGVRSDATPDDVKRAFHELSKKFHPDRYFRKNLGPFRAHLDTAFKALVDAHQTLSNPDKRAAYRKTGATARADSMPRPPPPPVSSSSSATRIKPTGGTAPTPAPQRAPPPPPPVSGLSKEREAERRDRIAKHPYMARMVAERQKAGGHLPTLHVRPPSGSVPAAVQPGAKGPEHPRLAEAAKAMAEGRDQEAIELYRQVVEGDSRNAAAAYQLGRLLEKTKGQVSEMVQMGRQAVDLEPKNVDYRMFYVGVLEHTGMKSEAKRQFDEAVKLNPEHPEVKKRGKKKWPF